MSLPHSSARIQDAQNIAPLDIEKRPAERSGSGSADKRSGSGSSLPAIPGIQWELNARGGFEAWHCPAGALHRKDKTYLGYLGKRVIAGSAPAQLEAMARLWVAERMKEKGIK